MSIIVAEKRGGTVYMGADSQTTYGDSEKKNSLIESNRKIFKFDNGMLLGGTGRGDDIMRLCYSRCVFEAPQGELTKKYIVNEIIPKLFAFADERKMLKEPDEDDPASKCCLRCSLVLVYKNKIFYIDKSFGVWENARFCVMGSGCSYAFPYLNTPDDSVDINDRLLAAMRASAKHDSSVSAPFILIDSKNLEFKVRG